MNQSKLTFFSIFCAIGILFPRFNLVAQSITLNMFKSDVSCAGMADGNAGVEVLGGLEPFTYLWSTGAETATIGNLNPGIYTVTVVDANGEELNNGVSLTEIDPISIGFQVTDGMCGDLGKIQAIITGGIGPFQYLWSNDKFESEIRNLEEGQYNLSVTDRGRCETVNEASVMVYGEGLKLSGEFVKPSCVGTSDGRISVSQTGGQMPIVYKWSDGTESSTSLENLKAGTYSISAEDAFGCTDGFVVILDDPDALEVEVINQSNSLFAKVEGGNPSYEYQWSNGVTGSAVISNLETGEYFLTVTDSNGCEANSLGEVLGPLSAENIAQIEDFTLYPSIVQNELKINLQLQESENISFEIFSTNGQLISNQQNRGQHMNLPLENISNLPSGLFFLRISSETGWSFTEKFIKQ